ncbi:undecaprenyldiphospho-muramoylpentapeptide beta-N-acetylglucosaminyltransferase [Nocardia farcinica]|uniref:UDP-N-acetylglucosamine--N-acetylmuramyl-(pentapeptide) pyrophosphoryl-undecaprenol N-acetylglucosamine transferase n=1 Tax=Nocardia farcinica (strain IFM 10152) TaxID=247156 RepID=MURG_NOCFA|nr:undecaprenyldiphospho-muramoylpentapeptide beta-N-acetylglucosaminyltransferase [Nocardia farcinica]Q5YYX9.1 RecName: Full=UDP-N-acetylglucosamine--N-acetylmuramyl-(pentapeptide) pyrophosphoryl-undecaprenol N-acetylglucosamine transferase; AltName: Full=Undecaprenyl-PP-MurNAc-pentapeptide-UDPGlcNAc GlcNAc transferase [Nocardia farcinica IFM 10152]MBA4859432.1 undecaprenyldiphospho-muramoylpentapeptide beta-N-acetylglucosaminyltransferase [Nocardia farcinica]MBC9819533.1 undecaprenyldiphospho-
MEEYEVTTKDSGSGLSVIVAGGGTAGHIEPALAVADALRRLDPAIRVTALGTERGLETRLVPERGYPLELIPPVPLPRKPTVDLLRLPARVRASVRRTRAVIDAVQADVIIGFGGYVALPAYLAAGRGVLRRRRAVPVIVHEANAKAGIANKIGARVARAVLAAVPDSGLPGAEVVGIPVRESITALDRTALRAEARAHFGLPDAGPVLLVFGGSQGARSLNEAIAGAAPQLAAAGISVLHAHGPKNTLDVPETGGTARYVAVPYLSRMDLAYAAADAVVCRSGAMTVAEVSAVGLPAFYVPLPHGNGEQEFNARPIVAQGGGRIVPDSELTPKYVIDEVIPLLLDRTRLTEMGRAAAGAGHRDAADEVARIAVRVAR